MGGFLLKLVLGRQGWAELWPICLGRAPGTRVGGKGRKIDPSLQEHKKCSRKTSRESHVPLVIRSLNPRGQLCELLDPLRFCAWDLRIQLKEDRLTEKRHTVVWYSFIFAFIYLGPSCSMQDLQSSLWHSGPLCGMWGLVPWTGIEPQSAES